MAFTDEVIQRTNQLEKLLIDRGGIGRGLQERAASLQDELDKATLAQIRSIANVRHRLMHEPEFEFEGNEQEFLQHCDETIALLNRRLASAPATASVPSAPPRTTALGPESKPLSSTNLKFKKPRRAGGGDGVPAWIWIVLLLALLGAGGWWYHQTHPDALRRLLAREVQMPPVMTVDEAQREALKRYPDLGVQGSKLNVAYVARYKAYQQQRPEFFQNPRWPLLLAEEVAKQ
jgi:hypothetical protein